MALKKDNFTIEDLSLDAEFQQAFGEVYEKKPKRMMGCVDFLKDMDKLNKLLDDPNPDSDKRREIIEQLEEIYKQYVEYGRLGNTEEEREELGKKFSPPPYDDILYIHTGSDLNKFKREVINPIQELQKMLLKKLEPDIKIFNDIQQGKTTDINKAAVEPAEKFLKKRDPFRYFGKALSQFAAGADVSQPSTRSRPVGIHEDTIVMAPALKFAMQNKMKADQESEKLKLAAANQMTTQQNEELIQNVGKPIADNLKKMKTDISKNVMAMPRSSMEYAGIRAELSELNAVLANSLINITNYNKSGTENPTELKKEFNNTIAAIEKTEKALRVMLLSNNPATKKMAEINLRSVEELHKSLQNIKGVKELVLSKSKTGQKLG